MSPLPEAVQETLFLHLAEAAPFRPTSAWTLPGAYLRPVALSAYRWAALVRPLERSELFTERSLTLGRLLFNIYEQNGLYLPEEELTRETREAFSAFYDPDLVAVGAALRPPLEASSLGWVDREIDVTGPWDLASLEEHAAVSLRDYEAAPSATCDAITAAAHPEDAIRLYLLQVAPDFISEASQMARALPGNYGPAQSELMKIFIDEFGYGVHGSKHSTLFQRTMRSVGLSPIPHAYFLWYLPTSLHMTNYFHRVTAVKTRWFEYLGALYWIEAVVPRLNRELSALMRRFCPEADTLYFDEHVGIDLHHRRMVLKQLIRPAIEVFGTGIIPDFVRGIAAARLLGDVAEQDYLEQLRFCEALERPAPLEAALGAEALDVEAGWSVGPRVADRTQELCVEQGEVEVEGGYLRGTRVRAGQRVVIPAGRLHGLRVAEGRARLRLGDAGV